MQWLMLQQEAPQDYVIAAGQQVSVRDFPIHAASQLDIKLAFEGKSADEVACVDQVSNATTAALSLGMSLSGSTPDTSAPQKSRRFW